MDNPGSQNVATCKPITTFVQTDTNTFRDVVQRLTGPSDNNIAVPEVGVEKPATPKKPASKLHERRQCMRPKLEIVKPPPSFKAIGATLSSKSGNITTVLKSPVGTPSSLFSTLSLMEEEKAESDIYTPNSEEEEKAIRERGFYLHPSPRSKPGHAEPELLQLFPLTSPNSSCKPRIQ
ncbi:PREDICTED: VQ motif-containing protein 31-like [Tarenaya hassleriana]|uniref:VQ motif-containing protein 31-like n=1 Tax=Tarenaya hassleriana TaxID=28532 RepID=UPI00053C087A|nr:PREDICTED: VQ motif-containing protein 31-like [Tarenaya hassleriana]